MKKSTSDGFCQCATCLDLCKDTAIDTVARNLWKRFGYILHEKPELTKEIARLHKVAKASQSLIFVYMGISFNSSEALEKWNALRKALGEAGFELPG